FLKLKRIPNGRNLLERYFLRALRGVNIKILHVGELGTLGGTKAYDDRDLLIGLAQRGDLHSAESRGGGIGHVGVRYAGEIGAIRINFKPDRRGFFAPVIVNSSGGRHGPQNALYLRGKIAERAQILRLLRAGDIGLVRKQDLNWLFYRIGL